MLKQIILGFISSLMAAAVWDQIKRFLQGFKVNELTQ